MIKAVIFDIGGTLFYSDKVANDHHQAAGQAVLDYLKKHHININVDASTFAAK
jgi:FMN phosphatase YigB (HAD superfamily)